MRWTGLLLLALALSSLAKEPALAKEPPPPMSPPVPSPPPHNCTAPEHRQFDFWIGNWDVRTTGRLEEMRGGSLIESINFGCGIRETWSPFTSIQGASLSTYDKNDKAWHQTYIDALGSRIEFKGGIENGKMVLVGTWRGLGAESRDGLMRMSWDRLDEGWVRQVGEISYDQGKTWQPSFDFTYVPRRP